jgi:uncharacterized protein YndB with AHSA1/START domain
MAVIHKQVDISATADQVFAALADPLRLMQLRSDWGELVLENVAENYPELGSTFRLRPNAGGSPYICVRVQEVLPDRKLVLGFDGGIMSRISWTLLPEQAGCGLAFEAHLQADSEQAVRQEQELAQSWLDNIKNFTALGRSGWQGALRWILERHVLKLRAEQRRVLMMLLALQLITLLTFVAALLGIGLVSLIVSWFRA